MNGKLKRSRTNRMIAGVCGGVGEYFNIDPVIVRIVWAMLFFVPGGPGFLFYLLCAIIIPEDDGVIYQNEDTSSSTNIGNTTTFIGIALIIVGGFMLAKVIWPHFAFRFMNVFKYWPVLLIIGGMYIIYNQKNK
ncbi:MAG: PspC domain-containing protein [Tissierellia bacterium]|nr:PspC domain-containing protein [Tissierellia bacterium]